MNPATIKAIEAALTKLNGPLRETVNLFIKDAFYGNLYTAILAGIIFTTSLLLFCYLLKNKEKLREQYETDTIEGLTVFVAIIMIVAFIFMSIAINFVITYKSVGISNFIKRITLGK